MLVYKYPFIENVSYLRGRDLLVEFSDGSTRIVDMLDSFNIAPAMKYFPIEAFKDFHFDKNSIWWGSLESSDSMEIGNDSLYRMSIEVSEFISSISTKIQALLMPIVFHERQPYNIEGRIRDDEYERPHMHIIYENITYQVRLEDGVITEPINVPGKIRKLLKPYAIKYRKEAVLLWNKWNPNVPADPETGKFIDRR
jgi:hypothetical protein